MSFSSLLIPLAALGVLACESAGSNRAELTPKVPPSPTRSTTPDGDVAPANEPAQGRANEPAQSRANTAMAQARTAPAWTQPPWSEPWLLEQGQRYFSDAPFRRQVLEASLTEPTNIYSRTRLTSYGVPGRGWELLPEWIPKTQLINDAYLQALVEGSPVFLDGRAEVLWKGQVPSTMAQWVALGRRVFYQYPLRSEVFALHALRSRKRAAKIGLRADENGDLPGLVAFETLDGKAEIGITCALCHVAIEGGKAIEGRANRKFDYGEMRLAFYRDTGTFLSKKLKRRMASWGPGRADITQDDTEDPVAIVDLWGVRNHSHLTQSGTLKHVHPAALAIRQETQILQANQERIRPPRELTWALSMYLYSLRPPKRPEPPITAQTERGKAVFAQVCDQCHRDAGYGGLLVSATAVGTSQALAGGKARGTGQYRPAPLLRVAEAAPYMHDGSIKSLRALLNPRRRGGHPYGTALPKSDRRALLAFLNTL